MLHYRKFPNYNEYVQMQGAKLSIAGQSFVADCPKRIAGFKSLFLRVNPYLNAGKVLCLGARAGWEVIGAEKAGFIGSIGIDLHPGNETVIQGDWHNIPFPEKSFENVFTNSIDHCLDLPKLVSEVRRVLIPSGVFFLLASYRKVWREQPIKDRMAKGLEALFWDHPDDLLPAFTDNGFTLVESYHQHKWCYYFLRRIADGD